MEDLKQEYKKTTGVDIDEQRKIWDERGKGYYGEFLLFCELYKHIQGNFKLLMNVELPFGQGDKTEIDLVMLHETGIYVFEVKHYKGNIYGDDSGNTWTQFFKNAKNSYFRNPIQQNGYHIRALKEYFLKEPVYSYIVFTNDDCVLHVENDNPHITVTKLGGVVRDINDKIKKRDRIFSINQLEEYYERLGKYSYRQADINNNKQADEVLPLHDYISPTLELLNCEKKALSKERESLSCEEKLIKQKLKKAKIKTVILGTAIVLIVSIVIALVGHFKIMVERDEVVRNQNMIMHSNDLSYVVKTSKPDITIKGSKLTVKWKTTQISTDYLVLFNNARYDMSDKYSLIVVKMADGKEYEAFYMEKFAGLLSNYNSGSATVDIGENGYKREDIVQISIKNLAITKYMEIATFETLSANVIVKNLELVLYSKQ